MQISTELFGGIITGFIALVGLAAWVGALSQKVKGHDRELAQYREQNSNEHAQILSKIDNINNYLRNGGHNG